MGKASKQQMQDANEPMERRSQNSKANKAQIEDEDFKSFGKINNMNQYSDTISTKTLQNSQKKLDKIKQADNVFKSQMMPKFGNSNENDGSSGNPCISYKMDSSMMPDQISSKKSAIDDARTQKTINEHSSRPMSNFFYEQQTMLE